MNTITDQPGIARTGTFSSSSMWKLMTRAKNGTDFGEKALTYIKQVGYERILGRAINKETSARATSWGTLVELYVFDLLPLDYKLVSTDRLVHPEIKTWTGAPDLTKIQTVADCKCPYSLEVFCDKLKALTSLAAYKKQYPEDYWQHISNSILLEKNGIPVTHFEAIIFCPYQRELDAIRLLAEQAPPEQSPDFYWMNYAHDKELPYLIEGGRYKNLNISRFEIPDEDKAELTASVLKAEQILNPSILLAHSENGVTLVEGGN